MTAQQVFLVSLRLIAEQARWTQGAFALAADGYFAPPNRSDAVCWCSVGAVLHTVNENTVAAFKIDPKAPATIVLNAMDEESRKHGALCLSDYNDNRSHAEVLQLWGQCGRRMGWIS